MITQKMFVHYSGNVAAFKQAGLDVTYNKSIVFIGNGEAIYTHGHYYSDVKDALATLQSDVNAMKYFSGIKVGDTTAWSAGKDGVITFTSDSNSVVTLDATPHGINIGLDAGFVKKVDDTATGLAEEIERAKGVEGKLSAALGTKDETKGTAFERIAAIEGELDALGGGAGSISTQINNAIAAEVERANGAYDEKGAAASAQATAIADAATKYQVKGDYEAAGAAANALQSAKSYTDTEIGKLSFDAAGTAETKANAALEAAKSYADGLAVNYDATGSAASALQDAKDYVDGKVDGKFDAAGSAATAKTEAVAAAKTYTDEKVQEINAAAGNLEARVKANEDAIDVLNGEGDGSVSKAVSDGINTWAQQVTNNQTIDTFKELVDYAATHSGEYGVLAGSVQSNTNAINVLKGDENTAGSVAKAVKDAVDAEAQRATGVESGLASRIKALEDDTTSAEGIEGLQGQINGINDEISDIKEAQATDKKALEDAIAAEKKAREDADALKANAADVASTVEGINAAIALKADASALNDAKDELQDAIDDLAAEHAADEKVTAEALTDLNTKYDNVAAAVTSGDAATLASAKTYVGEEIAKLDVEDAPVANQFVTSVSEVDGKISVSRAGIGASQINISNTEDDLFDASTVTVQDALAALANAWTWVEL